jgi:hypothetical protein
MTEMNEPVATCFISYSHADKPLAEALNHGLNAAGYRVWIDTGELRIGDSLLTAISGAIDQVDFLIALVSSDSVASNWCQKEISLAMTGEIARKGITVLPCQVGGVEMPATLTDKLYLKINAAMIDEAVEILDRDMRRHLTPSQPLPNRQRGKRAHWQASAPARASRQWSGSAYDPHVPIKITGVNTGDVGKPRSDGSRGSALYAVPFSLSAVPDAAWAEIFVQHWNSPPRYTTMHRPGTASVSGAQILLSRTTMDEVENYHLATLRLVIDATNRDRLALAEREDHKRDLEAARASAHENSVDEIVTRLKFD